jgi:hypothetical protein
LAYSSTIAGFLLVLLFDHDDRSDIFHRNFGGFTTEKIVLFIVLDLIDLIIFGEEHK